MKEAQLQSHHLSGQHIETVYFGGGTPSLLTKDELGSIMDALHRHYEIAPGAEITLEANPDDIEKEGKLQEWKTAGIDRLSIGVQSFFDEDLKWMNRVHNAAQTVSSIKKAQDIGIDNISIDLIYGTPGLTDDRWRQNVEKAVSLNIPHLSCYALTVEPKTALDKMIKLKKKEDVDAETQARQFLLLMDWLEETGYEHYEISNFAKPGRRSRHNSSYWKGIPYLGLGPSAHSYNGEAQRRWNIANNALYIKTFDSAPLAAPAEIENLTPSQQQNEYVMIALRTMEGLDLDIVAARWGQQAAATLAKQAQPYIASAHIRVNNARFILTRKGKLLADGISADLFVD